MKVFRNDVSIDEIPRVGTGTALVAARTTAGEAVLYTGPEDVVALAGFLGGVVMVNGVPYSEEGDGSLHPIKFLPGFAYVKPPAGPWFALHADELKQKHAVVTFDATTESDEVYAKGWADAEAKANADKVAPNAAAEYEHDVAGVELTLARRDVVDQALLVEGSGRVEDGPDGPIIVDPEWKDAEHPIIVDPVVAGTVVYPPRPEREEKVVDLMAALEDSVTAAKARAATKAAKK